MDLNMCWPNPPMPVRTQTASQHVLPNSPTLARIHYASQHVFPNSCFANENTKSISTCVHLTPLMPASSTKVLNKGWPNPTLKPQLNMSCQNHHVLTMPPRKQNASQLMSTNTSHACVNTKCVSTSVGPFQPGQNMYINFCWPSHSREVLHKMSSQASGETNYISTCIDQTPPLPARTQNAFQHLLSKRCYSSDCTLCILISVDHTPTLTLWSQNTSLHVFLNDEET